MPNHIFNELEITGSSKIIRELEEFVKSPKGTCNDEKRDFDFSQIIPKPSCVIDRCISVAEERQNPNRNWFSWNKHHWDTKWNAYGCRREDEGLYAFTTAWNPPRRVVAALSWLYPELTFVLRYWEECNDFHESATFENGEPI